MRYIITHAELALSFEHTGGPCIGDNSADRAYRVGGGGDRYYEQFLVIRWSLHASRLSCFVGILVHRIIEASRRSSTEF